MAILYTNNIFIWHMHVWSILKSFEIIESIECYVKKKLPITHLPKKIKLSYKLYIVHVYV